MTQKLDQMTATTLSSTPRNTTTAKINSLPSAFEQTDIQTTLKKTALTPEQLTHLLNLAEIPSSTKRIKPLNNFLGQDRARASVEAGISLPYSGYNIFAVGTAGLGKRTMIKRLLQQHAKSMPTPNDWVYVNNFKNPRQPIALRFPAGQGIKFQNALQQTWQIILKQLERRFSAESYHNRIERIRQDTGDVQQQALIELTKEGQELDLKLISRDDKHVFIPMQLIENEYQELTKNDLDALSSKDRAEITSNMRYMEKKLERLGLHLGDLEDDARDQVSILNREIATQVVTPRMESILNKNKEVKSLDLYLKHYAEDIIDNVELILEQEEDDFTPALFNRVPSRYQANVIVANKPNSGAPVISKIFQHTTIYWVMLNNLHIMVRLPPISP